MKLFFLPLQLEIPDALTDALGDYRQECVLSGMDFDGTAGLGNFSSLSDWLERLDLLSSPEADKRGWIRTAVFAAVRMPEGCSLSAGILEGSRPDGARTEGFIRVLGLFNVRLTEDEEAVRTAGHIGYHVRPSERRAGVGTAILTRATEFARENGIARPVVCISEDNLPSLALAKACGYAPDGRETLPTGETIRRLRFFGD